MEWYILDELLRKSDLIENFESFIWTERYSAWGDFQIVTKSDFSNRQLFVPDKWMVMAGSPRVMKIETVTDAVTEDGTRNLTVEGRSIEAFLDDRVAMPGLAGHNMTTDEYVIYTGLPAAIARGIFTSSCVTGVMSAKDTFPFYQSGTLFPVGSIAEPAVSVTLKVDPDTVYNTIKNICDIWSLGFRVVRNGETGQIYFEIYTGNDLTAGQTVRNPVIFSLAMDNLGKTTHLSSTATLKTVAYVYAKNGSLEVYPDIYSDTTAAGVDRRVLLVKATDIDLPAGAPLNAAMLDRGRQELAKNQRIYTFDGEIPQHTLYEYGIDYNLGDMVEEWDKDGGVNTMLVTEHISVSDKTGESSYPTLSLFSYVYPGSWRAEIITEDWADVDINKYWNMA
jgi:hypothetical protein